MLPFILQTASTTLMPSVRANTCLEGSINLSDLIPRLSQEHKGEDAEATHCFPGEFERTSPFRFHVPSASHTLPALLGTKHARGTNKHWPAHHIPHATFHRTYPVPPPPAVLCGPDADAAPFLWTPPEGSGATIKPFNTAELARKCKCLDDQVIEIRKFFVDTHKLRSASEFDDDVAAEHISGRIDGAHASGAVELRLSGRDRGRRTGGGGVGRASGGPGKCTARPALCTFLGPCTVSRCFARDLPLVPGSHHTQHLTLTHTHTTP